MEVKIIPCLNDNYSYLIFDKIKKVACVVDPSEAKPVIKFIEKFNVDLKYILNTHHHYDHVGGNIELKKRFNSKIIGFQGDKNRIPGIDILVDNNQNWIEENFQIKIYHIPGHTSGHICFYLPKEKMVFSGDTLFSLGCGRIFEGSHRQMYESLNKFKRLPAETKVYCGHEYTLENSKFCLKYDSNNKKLKKKIKDIKEKIKKGLPSIPSKIQEEIDCNIFMKANDLESFSKLRDLKDNF